VGGKSQGARLWLTRLFQFQGGTYSILRGWTEGVLELYAVERAWAENRPFVSCVPPGDYTLTPHHSPRYPKTWALVGTTVAHYPSEGKARSAILFHAANLPHQLSGCIAPGINLGTLDGRVAAVQSTAAMARLRAALEEGRKMSTSPPRLTIENSPHFA